MRLMRSAALLFVCAGVLFSSAPAAFAQAREVDKATLEKMVNFGVAFLKNHQAGQGAWNYSAGASSPPEHNVGTTALVGLALLESEVSPTDPAVLGALRNVRAAAPSLTTTYAISLAILFLDRYPGGKDEALIQRLALRLAAGQSHVDGGWTYKCPILNAKQEADWIRYLERNRNASNVTGSGPPKGAIGSGSDNSNTQFAVLAFWVARNHRIPVQYSLYLAEWRFRNSQGPEGGWDYGVTGPGHQVTPGMTCAGLLGLAVAYGAKREYEATLRSGDRIDAGPSTPVSKVPTDYNSDPVIIKAKSYLAGQMRNPQMGRYFLYYLWSLERVSVTYKWKDYDGVDWHQYGCNFLMNQQQQDGSWSLEHGANVDTSFALLFIKRANLVGDISGTATLRATNVSDPLKGTTGGAVSGASKPKPAGSGANEISEEKTRAEAKKLMAEFLSAKPSRQEEILETLQETRDPTGWFTLTLAEMIPVTRDALRGRVQTALAERLSRLTPGGLQTRLMDEDSEIRLAAARALAIKAGNLKDDEPKKREMLKAIPNLIKLLSNSNEDLAAAAETSLTAITEKEFGRNPQRWQEYYDKLKIK